MLKACITDRRYTVDKHTHAHTHTEHKSNTHDYGWYKKKKNFVDV